MVIMNTRQRVSLISRLRQNKVPQNKIDKLFNLPEKDLDKLYLISNNELFINEVAKLLSESKEKYGFYLDSLKELKNQFSNEEYNEAIALIKNSSHTFNARYIIIILKNEFLQNKKLQLVGARLISNAKREVNAEYALRILTISKLHDLNIAIPMAELIVGTENREECLNIIREILSNEDALNEVNGIVDRLTTYLRRTLITVPGHEEEATDLLNIFSEILNKPLIVTPVKVEKKRVRKLFTKNNN